MGSEHSRRFGDIAVRQGFVSPAQLEQALERQRTLGVPVGEALVELGLVTGSQVAAILKLQRVLLNLDEAAARGEVSSQDPLLGHLLGGCLLLEILGKGAMGTTYKAHHLKLDRDVCVKVVNQDVGKDRRSLERFIREARSAARLEHPGIVQVFDMDQTGAHAFIVMQLVDGKSLKDVLDSRGPLGAKRATYVGARVADALAAAHREKIVHRDVKPANVLISKKGHIKLTDFGLVRVIDPGTESGSSIGELIGTPSYMSPEQAQAAHELDGRSDVYSLGIMIYELASGKLPFQAGSLIALLKKQMLDPLPTIRGVCPDAPPGFDELLQRLCAKRPEQRLDAESAARELRGLYRAAFGPDSSRFDFQSPSASWLPRDLPARSPAAAVPAAAPQPAPRIAELPTDFYSKREVLEAAADKLVARALRGELVEALKQAQRLSPPVAREVTVRVLSTLAAAGRQAEVVAAQRTIEELAGDVPQALLALARAQMAVGKTAAAESSLAAATQRLPDDADLALELAQFKASLGKKDEARRVVADVLARRPQDEKTHRAAAELLYVVLQDLEEAQRVYGVLAELDHNAFEPRQHRGSILLELGRPAEAAKALEDAIAREPGSPLAHELLARARRAKGDSIGARAALRRTLELDPDAAGARRMLIEDASSARLWDEVGRLAEQGLTRRPDDAGFLVAFARAREATGDTAAAARVFANVLQKSPQNAEARAGLERLRRVR